MTPGDFIIPVLCMLLFSQQYLIHKLTAKIMSRNYHDYVVSEVLSRDKKKEAPKLGPQVDEENIDLGYLNPM